MRYKGHIRAGVVVLDEKADLPEGTRVDIRPIAPPKGRHHPDIERFAGIIPLSRETNAREEFSAHLRTKHE
jgi:hypothetical protein